MERFERPVALVVGGSGLIEIGTEKLWRIDIEKGTGLFLPHCISQT